MDKATDTSRRIHTRPTLLRPIIHLGTTRPRIRTIHPSPSAMVAGMVATGMAARPRIMAAGGSIMAAEHPHIEAAAGIANPMVAPCAALDQALRMHPDNHTRTDHP